jgi:hypothetical protein
MTPSPLSRRNSTQASANAFSIAASVFRAPGIGPGSFLIRFTVGSQARPGVAGRLGVAVAKVAAAALALGAIV